MLRAVSVSRPPTKASLALAFYFLIALVIPTALRIDRFPLSWAPMYAMNRSSDSMWVSVFDGESVRTRGFEIVRRDGSTGWLSHVDMNIPFRAFGKIFTQRAFGLGPPKHRRAIDDAGQIDLVRVDWASRIMTAANETLGLRPEDPRFIVEMRARRSLVEVVDLHGNPRLVGAPYENVSTLRWENGAVSMTLDHEPPRGLECY